MEDFAENALWIIGGLYVPFPNLGFSFGSGKTIPKVGFFALYKPFPNRGFFTGVVRAVLLETKAANVTQKWKKSFTVGFAGCNIELLFCQKGPFASARF